ncbi:MAG TPA: amidohydrolase family protein, partial [Ilumatobacteraceae bacterium]|nr:amidohydrolase family protein [Ilumatobacteraceae bacterium]
MSATVLQRATILGGEIVDVRIEGPVIDSVGPTIEPQPGDVVVDLEGFLLLASAVEPHAHLDKAFLAERIENPTGDLMGAILAMQANRHLLDVPDIIERAERAARLMAANGFTAVRTHADTTREHGLRSIEALLEVKKRVADVIDVQIVSLCGWPMTGVAGAANRALLREALEAGADLVGGCPHLEGAASASATEFFLAIAAEFAVPVDLHTDETLDRAACGLSELARGVLAGFPHAATASHCVSLGQLPVDEQRAVAELVAEAGVNVIALPHTNLFLQGRGTAPMPRGLTAVGALRAAGVNVAAGADNLQDPFNPVGRACPFETAGLMIMSVHDLPAVAWSAVTVAPRRALGLPPVAVTAGAPADLMAVRAATVREAIAT